MDPTTGGELNDPLMGVGNVQGVGMISPSAPFEKQERAKTMTGAQMPGYGDDVTLKSVAAFCCRGSMEIMLVGSDVIVTKNRNDLLCCCNTVIEELIDLRKVHKVSRYTPSCWRNTITCCCPWMYTEGVEIAYGPGNDDRLFIPTKRSKEVYDTIKARLDGLNA